jgi:flagellar assembly protein FliH
MPLVEPEQPAGKRTADVELSNEEFAATLHRERSEASAETERRLREEYEAELERLRGSVAEAVAGFELQRNDYFARVEAEVVQLALSIAAKILHREAQVDPMLVAALVRMTIEKMREGTSVTVRVSPGRAGAWQQCFSSYPRLAVRVVEDAEVSEADCVLETDLGTTHVGLDRQLKEVEQGFFDLLALRPESR